MGEPAGRSTNGRGALLPQGGITRRLALALCVVNIVAGSLTAGATASSGAKGSSCAHPYRVHWDVPQGHLEGRYPEEMLGDTRYIKARAHGVTVSFTDAYMEFSWAPRVPGLKLCQARITFDWRKPLVSHQWHRQFVKVPKNPDRGYVLSFVVTAAR